MPTTPSLSLCTILAVTGCFAHSVSAQQKTLLFVSRYDSVSLDATAGILGKARPFGIFAVTPGTNATAFPYLPSAATSALSGDPDNDGKVAEFTGLKHDSVGFGGLFVKHADRKSNDASRVYRTVLQPAQPAVTIKGYSGTTVHTIRPGDFVRWQRNGDLEFFIRQEQIMKAAGKQTVGIPGAAALCQTSKGDLIYAPARNLNGQGGHHINNPISTWCNDGSFIIIPAKDITYDKDGNVSDVKTDSAVQLAEETSGGPRAQPSVRAMVQNSGAVDSIGKLTSVTFTLVGIDIDPNGGTWTGNYGHVVPNLIFTFNNTATTCCGGPWGSWHGTVFSTTRNTKGVMGSIAKINGVTMGATSGKADGRWTGVKQGSGHANAPVIRGLAWLDVGFKSTKPHGSMVMQTINDGTIDATSGVQLAIQGVLGGFPMVLGVSWGTLKGARPTGLPMPLWDGFDAIYLRPPFLAVLGLVPPGSGQITVIDKLPNDPRIKGANFVWQAVGVTFGKARLSNPVITEVR